MKLRNKKTLIVVDAEIRDAINDGPKGLKVVENGEVLATYTSLAQLNEEWEDYEEPEGIQGFTTQGEDVIIRMGSIEEAEKAVEKLKAWKRLKNNGFRFEGIKEDYTRILQSQDPFRTGKRYLQFNKSEDEDWMKENWEDLALLFGGEE